MVCVIKGTKDDALTQVTTYVVNKNTISPEKTQIYPGKFWDVVGDFVITSALKGMQRNCGEGNICCLLPGFGQSDGSFYAVNVIQQLFHRTGKQWKYLLFDAEKITEDYGIPHYSTDRWETIIRKEHADTVMAKSLHISSLDDFMSNSHKQSEHPAKEGVTSLSAYMKGGVALSPLDSGSDARISTATRNNALAFAHPVDKSIIKVLDNPAINSVVNKIVQTSIDANYGLALATGIHVTPSTYNYLYEVVVECAESLNMPVPYVVVSDTVRGINACTAGTDQFAFVAVSSMLTSVMSRDQLKFVIGHELGHLALGHVVYHTAINLMGAAGSLLPLVGPIIDNTLSVPLNAWSRRSEISADRAGLICCGDIQTAKKALFRLEAGFMDISEIDVDAYVRNSEAILHSSTFGKLAEINQKHPIIPKRIKALDYFAQSEVYAHCMGHTAAPGALSEAALAQEVEKILSVF